MNFAITTLYIPHIDTYISKQFIADVFQNNQIAEIAEVIIKPRYYLGCNSAYVRIKNWCDTEVAYNFIKRLCNNNIEARIIYMDDLWWSVSINKYPYIFDKPITDNYNALLHNAIVYNDSDADTECMSFNYDEISNYSIINNDSNTDTDCTSDITEDEQQLFNDWNWANNCNVVDSDNDNDNDSIQSIASYLKQKPINNNIPSDNELLRMIEPFIV